MGTSLSVKYDPRRRRFGSSSMVFSSTDNSQTNNKSKQSKKRKNKSYKKISIDLDLTDSVSASTPIISWNCHHKLENIEKTLIKIQSNYDDNNIPSVPQQSDIGFELECIKNDITSTIYGITHNALDELPNERALLDHWVNTASLYRRKGVILFEIGDMDKIHETLGWKSGDNIIIETGKKIGEYCDWYKKDYNLDFKLFHPDFAINEFIVITNTNNARLIEDFCDCVLLDVARSVKCFFQETLVWAGYVTNHNGNGNNKKHESPQKDDELVQYEFRSWYEKCQIAIKDATKLSVRCAQRQRTKDRIKKWLSKETKLENGHKIAHIIHTYYVTNYGGFNQYSSSTNKKLSITSAMKQMEIIIKNGADLNYCDKSGNTPIFYAISIKNEALVRFLLKHEFNADHRNVLGQTALIVAMKNELPESICVELAKRLSYPNIPDNQNITPFVYALKYGYFNVMNILTKKGAMDYKNWIISSLMNDQDIVLCDILNQNGIAYSVQLDDIGRSVLHYAVLHKSYKIMIKFLKNSYVHPDIVDANGWSPLHYASAKNYCKIIEILAKYDADMHLQTSDNALTPFNVAKKYKSYQALQLLYKYEQQKIKRINNMIGNIGNIQVTEDDDNDSTSDQLSTSEDSKDDDDDGDDYSKYYSSKWDKENQDNNANHNNQSKRKSESESQKTHNSENVNKNNKQSNVSMIDEKIINELNKSYVINEEYDSEQSSSAESSRTRIVHKSFSNQSRKYRNIKNNNCHHSDIDDDDTISFTDDSRNSNDGGNYLNAEYLIDKIETGIIESPN